MVAMLSTAAMSAKTLVAYYSYTNNVERIVSALRSQITADVIEIEPAEKGLDYAADNYALGTQLLTAIRNNPTDASSYQAIDPVDVNMDDYDMVIIAVPLWWSQMAAPFQTYLFQYGPQMAGKHIGVIVSSASSGISGVVADAKRLIPGGNFIEPSLWIRSSQTSDASAMISSWLSDIHYNDLTAASISVTPDEMLAIEVSKDIIAVTGLQALQGDDGTLALYDTCGNMVAGTARRRLSTAAISPGVYIVRAYIGGRCMTRKINIR